MQDPLIEVVYLADEVRSEAQKLRHSSLPPGLEEQLEAPFRRFVPAPGRRRTVRRMRSQLAEMERRAPFEGPVPIASERPLGVPIKRGIRTLVSWYVESVVHKARDFAVATVRTTRVVLETLEDLDRDLGSVEERVRKLESEVRRLAWEGGGEQGEEPRDP